MSGPEPRSVRWAGTRALLVECAGLPDVLALHAHLAAHPLRGQLEATGAAGTVLVTFESAERARAAVGTLRELTPDAARDQDARAVEIPVVYDGEDLAELTHLTGRSGEELIAAHSGTIWRAAFGGFAPGFAYLTPEPGSPWEGIDVPRRSSPRTAVPAGSVAVAGGFSAVYPSRSPGGWQLIGHTDAVLWDLHRDPPALIRPGDLVRYTAVRELVEISSPSQPPTSRRRPPPRVPGRRERWWSRIRGCSRWSRTAGGPAWPTWVWEPPVRQTPDRPRWPTAWWAIPPVRR